MFNDNDNKKTIKIQEGNYKPVVVKAVKQGKKFCEVRALAKPTRQGVKRISKTEYIVLKTNEIKKFKSNTLKQNENLKKTFNKLRGLIRANFDETSKNQLFVTLTYAENMTDEKRLYTDFKDFMKRLKYAYKGYKFEYISVAEPQGRGAWHLHVMLKATNTNYLYIDNKDMARIWGHGMTKTEHLKSDDVGSYYVAYFTDILSESADPKSKKHIKGSRLALYPKGFNFYRCSRGIKKPTEVVTTIDEVKKEYGQPIYEKSYEIIQEIKDGEYEDEKVVNKIYKATFKKKCPQNAPKSPEMGLNARSDTKTHKKQ